MDSETWLPWLMTVQVFVAGCHVGARVQRYLGWTLAELGLSASEQKQVESAVEERASDGCAPGILVVVFGGMMVATIWINFTSSLLRAGGILLWISALVPCIVFSLRLRKRVLREEVEKIRGSRV